MVREYSKRFVKCDCVIRIPQVRDVKKEGDVNYISLRKKTANNTLLL